MNISTTIRFFLFVTLSVACLNLKAQELNENQNGKGNHINTKAETPVKVFEHVIGTWKVDSVFKGKKNVTSVNKKDINTTINFNENGKYVRYASNQKIDSGTYRANENLSVIYLESASNKPVTEWTIQFNENTLTLQRKNSADNLKYLYRKVEN